MNLRIASYSLISCMVLLALLVFGCSNQATNEWTKDTPSFEDFETKGFCNLTMIATYPRWAGFDLSIETKNELREQFQNAQFFNCDYKIITISETERHNQLYIFNALTGELVDTLYFSTNALFKKESFLIIIDNLNNGASNEEGRYVIMENEKLKQIK